MFTADRFVRLLKWAAQHPIPDGYLPQSCYETEFICRTEEFRGIAIFENECKKFSCLFKYLLPRHRA